MIYKNLLKIVMIFLLVSSCSSNKTSWTPLYNGRDLTGWNSYLGPNYDTVQNKQDSVPIGLNNDPKKVFTVVKEGDENVIRISGENTGGISSVGEYENYHLQLQFKWGQLQWAPRKHSKKDSGLMYHSVGPDGADGGYWMRSHEFQIEEGDCGDYWACAGAIADVKARKTSDSTYVYDDKNGEMFTFSTVSPTGRYCIKNPDAEKPTGEWNTLDLYCFGNTSVHMVNGVVTMILHNSRQTDGDKEIPLIKGKIQIQSEGSEIYFRDIKIASIDKLPSEFVK
jgi:hypothetical protein